jgi:8-oxo-dGTP pyrophosphatase MutT (NUDIX family)
MLASVEWTVHGERCVYSNPYVSLCLVDVEQPDGRRWEYHVVRLRSLAAVVLVDQRDRVLLMWRHRFITGSWGWELPMGLIEDGETPEQAARRELVEETGYEATELIPLVYGQPANGITDSEHFVFLAEEARRVAEPTELNESDRLEWIETDKILDMIDRREISSSASLIGLMRVLLARR